MSPLLHVRITDEQAEYLDHCANRRGITLSDLVREALSIDQHGLARRVEALEKRMDELRNGN